MSLYAKYLVEKTNDRIIEAEHGFATYRMIPDQKAVYVVDIFVDSDFRKSGLASLLEERITEIAKKEGCVKMLGSLVPSNKHSTESLKYLLACGMRLQSSTNDFIVFEKEI